MMVKATLAEPCVGMTTRTWPSIDDYADAKGDCVWAVIREADRWAWDVAWVAGASDA
jgi:hypothetical protein